MLYRRTSADEVLGLERDPDGAAHLLSDGLEDGSVVDVGRAWHGLHVLLTGSAWGGTPPLSDAVLGGTPLGDPTTYEPVRLLLADEVAAVAAALPAREELVPRFTHRKMKQAEAYPDVWDEPDVLMTFLLPSYDALLSLFQGAADAGDALLITLDREALITHDRETP